MSYYDPWTHAIKIFLTRILQLIALSLTLGLLVWYVLLHWFINAQFLDATRVAISGDNHGVSLMFTLCLINGTSLTGWLFTFINMRWPARNRGIDRHHRGARIINHDNE